MWLFESLKKTFLASSKDDFSKTSLTTEEDKKIRVLGGDDVELPVNYNIKSAFFGKSKSKKHSLKEKEDSLIKEYRNVSTNPEVASAIDEICNDAISNDSRGNVSPAIAYDDNVPENVQNKISENFDEILKLLDFTNEADDLFKRWYIDSKLAFEVVYDDNIKKGIKKLVLIDPIGLRKKYDQKTGKTYYVYAENEKSDLLQIDRKDYYDEEQIIIIDSGIYHDDMKIGYLFYALKTINNMTTIEDSFVIYRILRAVETRIWNVNTGKLPKSKAENYLNKVINEIRSDLIYDANTGNFRGKQSSQSLVNDFVFPTRNGNESTSVDTIGGQTNFIDSTEDHEMFLKKLYIAMKIPVTRIENDSTLDFSGADLTKGEQKFTQFVNKLRRQFSKLFLNVLKLQLLSKGIIKENEWDDLQGQITFKWNGTNVILENALMDSWVKKSEVLSDLEDNGILGKFISYEFVISEILHMTKDEFEEEKKKIKKEKKEGWFNDDEDEE